jgi:hypothetical protein
MLLDRAEYVRGLWLEDEMHWIDHWIWKWSSAKRKVIEHSVACDDVLPNRVKTMVKREVYHKAPVTKARAIQFYVNEATKASHGWEFYSLQKAWTRATYRTEWYPGIRVTFASGMNSRQLGVWLDEVLLDVKDPHYYERDGKNWDASMSEHHHRLKMAAYKFMPPAFLKFVEACFRVTGCAVGQGGRVKYRIVGTVKSGHNDTTLGNTIVNAALASTAMKRLGMTGDIIVAGDDMLAVVDGDFDLERFVEMERSMGIYPEASKFDSWLDVSFISGYWWANGGSYVFTPKIGRLCSRLWWTVTPPSRRQLRAYQRGVAYGLAPTCQGLAVVRELIRPHLDGGERMAIPGKDYTLTSSEILWDEPLMWRQLEARYGIAKADVEHLEGVLRTCTEPMLVVHPAMETLMNSDDLDPAERHRSHWR